MLAPDAMERNGVSDIGGAKKGRRVAQLWRPTSGVLPGSTPPQTCTRGERERELGTMWPSARLGTRRSLGGGVEAAAAQSPERGSLWKCRAEMGACEALGVRGTLVPPAPKLARHPTLRVPSPATGTPNIGSIAQDSAPMGPVPVSKSAPPPPRVSMQRDPDLLARHSSSRHAAVFGYRLHVSASIRNGMLHGVDVHAS